LALRFPYLATTVTTVWNLSKRMTKHTQLSIFAQAFFDGLLGWDHNSGWNDTFLWHWSFPHVFNVANDKKPPFQRPGCQVKKSPKLIIILNIISMLHLKSSTKMW